MSKEQLKELKYWKMNLNETLVLNGHEISEELKEETRKYRVLLAYAIEQAEQVQELEEQLQGLHKMYDIRLAKSDEFEEQNKRYREAIILALQAQKEHGLSAGLVIKCMTQELERALECEE